MRTEPIARTPARRPRLLGIGAGVVALLVAGVYSTNGGLVGLVGLAGLVLGAVVAVRRVVTIGAALLLGGVLIGGLDGAPAIALLVGVGATVYAWDACGFAIDLGAQLGREAPTGRVEAVHAVGTAAVVAMAAGFGYGVFRSATGGQPVVALLLLLVAGVVLLSTLDYS